MIVNHEQKGFIGSVKSGVGLIVLALLLLFSVMMMDSLSNMRLDLTQDGLYTLSDGTLNILNSLSEGESLQLRFFYSDKVTEDLPSLRIYAKRVEEMLEEYVLQSDGKLEVFVIDPLPFSELEDLAVELGLQGVPNQNSDMIYFGLVGENSSGHREVIEFFNPDKESELEYELSQMVYRLVQTEPMTIGVLSDLPIFQSVNYQTRQIEDPKVIMEHLRAMFDIKRVYDPSIEKVDDDIDLLMVVHPRLWPQKTLYAIDQFVLRGGRLLVFMDPDAEMDESEGAMFQGFQDRSSSLEELLEAWGVAYDPKRVLLDYTYAHSIPTTRYGQPIPHVGVLGMQGEAINAEENMTAGIELVNIGSSGAMAPINNSGFTFMPLIQSSEKSQLINIEDYSKVSDHNDLLRNFSPDGGGPYTVAAFVQGKAKTAFPDGKPVKDVDLEAEEETNITLDEAEVDKGESMPHKHLSQSVDDIAVVMVADTDILDDRMWVDVNDFYGQKVATPWAGNGDLVVNILESLSGSVDLISVRGRGTYQRPFDRVLDLQRKAGEQFRDQQEVLMAKLEEAEVKLQELNERVAPVSDAGELMVELTPEQEAEIEKFEKEKFSIRKKLREVQHQLDKDIETLGTQLKIINIGAMPLLLMMVALLMMVVKRNSRRRV